MAGLLWVHDRHHVFPHLEDVVRKRPPTTSTTASQYRVSGAPQLIANVGNAFTMVWVAYAFYGVPLIISLSKPQRQGY
ncbi:hypothetical protein B0H14DRAFT_3504239 [Mycena olivaceomarginata]|nr:hypothetical protein B0H14DRAFT_3504239 [Mycena olivaceomarginata]